jgi:hypothetical protein
MASRKVSTSFFKIFCVGANKGSQAKKALYPAVSLNKLMAMAKQSLGRDLGTLMGRNPKEEKTPVSAGVRSLMSGQHPPASVQAASPAPVATKPIVPRWYLLAGDVLLVALALMTLYKSPHPLSWQRELFCSALVVLAAVLAVLALLTPDGKAAKPPNSL